MKNYEIFDFENLHEESTVCECVNLFGEKCDLCKLETPEVDNFEPNFE